MDRIFGQFFGGSMLEPSDFGGMQQARRQWAPSMDISQTDREWVIEADLPGVKKDDISVEVENGYLRLRAEMRQEEQQPQDNGQGQGGQARQYQRRERRCGFFERLLPLPENVDEEKIACEFKDGVLTLRLPKQPQAVQQPRRIQVTDGSQGQVAPSAAGSTPAQVGRTTGAAGMSTGRQPAEEEEAAMAGTKGGEAASGTEQSAVGTRSRRKKGS